MIPSLKIAFGADFLQSFSNLPLKTQNKTRRFIDKFKENPTLSGLNYENITNARDSQLKSVRVDDNYRAIVRKPEKGNTYLLLWVDKHDRAYEWAQNRVCKINPESGAIQIIDIEQVKKIEEDINKDKTGIEIGRFKDIPAKDLLRLGIPEEYLTAVYAVVTDADIDQLLPELPEEAADAVLMLGAGYTLNEVYQEIQKTPNEDIDTEDLDTALTREDSKRRFYLIEDDSALAAILDAPLEKWRVFLHPTQRRLVERDWNGPVRVLGGAGTGKTVVAMHRAKWLLQNRFTDENDRILFTTFTKNLAIDIEANLRKICSSAMMRRIKVINIDAWVVNFLKSEGVNIRIVYDEKLQELWQKAYSIAPSSPDLPLSFYQDEWKEVIQANDIKTEKDYLRVSRKGRGTSLKRAERVAIWAVFEEYRTLLQIKGWKEIEDALRDARSLLEKNPDMIHPFKSIIVDEAQDMSEGVFRLLRILIPQERTNDLFIVGDPHQRIYGNKVVLSQCGIEIRGRSKKLRINYRTTEEIRQWATAILEGLNFDDLNGNEDNLKEYRSLLRGEKPIIQHFTSETEEIDFLIAKIKELNNNGIPLKSICLTLRTNTLVNTYEAILNQHQIKTTKISKDEGDNQAIDGLRVATMHRVKGLQFDYMLIPCVNYDIIPLQSVLGKLTDETAKNNFIQQERSLLHVAVTRAKRGAIVSSYDQCSFLITNSLT
ncbi:UvrD-helicase domain-containing protein [Cyanobacterium aponinum AL20118]|uniref:DNA 3'-5' helicase n=1 Tax=Cyanobacterium aponinum AL20115 TaxID=3090662 RepID=A0AAF0ZEG8_9CHRO|nr:UvrD-helicase domain-containing protein [Cyanobacterium aponinum]WPF88873.1 UvrD-helicase domain-containing protein [Cyanobacterium aponinum AL20115]